MIGFIVGLAARFGAIPKWAQNLMIYAAIALAVLWAFRLWGNRQYEAGIRSGNEKAWEKIIKDKEAEWAERVAAIDKYAAEENQRLEAKRETIEAQLVELARQRATNRREFNSQIERITEERDRRYADVNSIPATELDSAIRDLSNAIAGHPAVNGNGEAPGSDATPGASIPPGEN